MAQVNFRKAWFGPDGARYRKGLQEVPNALLDKLPSSAVKVEVAPVVEDEDTPVVKTPVRK